MGLYIPHTGNHSVLNELRNASESSFLDYPDQMIALSWSLSILQHLTAFGLTPVLLSLSFRSYLLPKLVNQLLLKST